ncbi:MAG TPA: 50S ribosomal protein L24 [bacterium]|jgi:large subunit ribosomal protein L24|nr:50S ribosomal protein L24 [bacterium]
MKIRKDDKVKVISGKDRGKIAKVLRVLNADNKVVVEGVNVVKKHVKPGVVSKEGGIISIEKPIDVSDVMYYDEQSKETVKIGYKIIDGKKYRISRKTGEVLDKKI